MSIISNEPELRCCARCWNVKPLNEQNYTRGLITHKFDEVCLECRRREGEERENLRLSRRNRRLLTTDGTIWCSRCRRFLPEDDFCPGNKRYGWCRECQRRYRELTRETKQAYDREYSRLHAAEKRKAAKDWNKAHPERANKNAKRSREKNADRQKQRQRKYQKEHPDKIKVLRHNARARRRALPNTLTDADVQRANEYFKGCCAVCGRPLNGLFHKAALDHWIPIADTERCPGTVPTNMVPLCHGSGGCNNSKCSKDPHNWLVERFGARKAKQIEKRIATYFDWVSTEPVRSETFHGS